MTTLWGWHANCILFLPKVLLSNGAVLIFRQLVSSIPIFVLLSSTATAGIADLTGADYGEAVQSEVQQKLLMGEIVELDEVTSGNHSRFQVPNLLHNPGMRHSAIYRYSREGKSRLVKTILPDSEAFISDEYFRQEVFGMLLSSHVGGPEVFRAGRIKSPDGQIGYFLEMEEIFHGATDTYTYKGFGSKTPLRRFLTFRFPSNVQLQKIAKLIRFNLERGVAIGIDPDFIFSGNDVRWIDTVEWRLFSDDISIRNFESEMALHNYAYLLTQFFRLKPRAGRWLVHSLKEEINKSKVWNTSQKAGILSNLKEGLVNNWHWSEADYLGDSPAREPLINRCVRLLSGSSS